MPILPQTDQPTEHPAWCDPLQLGLIWLAVAGRLIGRLGVTLQYVPLSPELLGDFDGATSTLVIRANAEMEDQVWLLRELHAYLTNGLEGSPAARPSPLLRLIPSPREASR